VDCGEKNIYIYIRNAGSAFRVSFSPLASFLPPHVPLSQPPCPEGFLHHGEKVLVRLHRPQITHSSDVDGHFSGLRAVRVQPGGRRRPSRPPNLDCNIPANQYCHYHRLASTREFPYTGHGCGIVYPRLFFRRSLLYSSERSARSNSHDPTRFTDPHRWLHSASIFLLPRPADRRALGIDWFASRLVTY